VCILILRAVCATKNDLFTIKSKKIVLKKNVSIYSNVEITKQRVTQTSRCI